MAIASFGQDNFFYDLSPLIETTTRRVGVIESLNLFDINHDRGTSVIVERYTDQQHLIEARQRQGERNWIGGNVPTRASLIVPFFPVDANIKPVDIQNFNTLMDLGSETPRTVADAVNRKMRQIRNAEAKTKERIYTEAVMGRSYAGITPENANESYDYYEVWNQTQRSVPVDFASTDINPTDVIEDQIRGYIIDAKQDGTNSTNMVAICGRQYFQALVSSPFTRAAYAGILIPGGVNPLRERIGGNADARSWSFNGVLYIEDVSGAVAANEAWFMPDGVENMFQAFYAPSDTLDEANQPASEFYMFMERTNRTAHIETEFSLLAVNTRPELVVRSTIA